MPRPESIEGREEKKTGSGEIKLKRHLLIEFRLIKDIGGNVGAIAMVM